MVNRRKEREDELSVGVPSGDTPRGIVVARESVRNVTSSSFCGNIFKVTIAFEQAELILSPEAREVSSEGGRWLDCRLRTTVNLGRSPVEI